MIGIMLVLSLAVYLYYENRLPKIYLDENVSKKILFQILSDESETSPPAQPFFDQKKCQIAVIRYMAKPDFRSSDFIAQVTDTDSRLEIFQVDENKLYFSHPISGFSQDITFSAISNNPAKVELGILNDDESIQIDRYIFNRPQSVIFSLSASDLKFDKKEYYLAETTYPNFKIGLTAIDKDYKIQYLQKPGDYQKFLMYQMGLPSGSISHSFFSQFPLGDLFLSLVFINLNLFRVSCFEFRI